MSETLLRALNLWPSTLINPKRQVNIIGIHIHVSPNHFTWQLLRSYDANHWSESLCVLMQFRAVKDESHIFYADPSLFIVSGPIFCAAPSLFIIQFSSATQLCQNLCDPMNCSTLGLPVHHQFLGFTQTHVPWVGDAIQPSHPLLSPSPPAPSLS